MNSSAQTTTDSPSGRADTTRQQILHAAAHQFARRAYHDVGLDDILAAAQLTKGAMYFHFRSKHALAVAIIEQHTAPAGLLSRSCWPGSFPAWRRWSTSFT